MKSRSENDLVILNFLFKLGKITGLLPFETRIRNFIFNTFTLVLHILGMGSFYKLIIFNQQILPGKIIHIILTRIIFFSYFALFSLSSWATLHHRKNQNQLIKNLKRFEKVIGVFEYNKKTFIFDCLKPILYHCICFIIKIFQIRKYSFLETTYWASISYMYGMLFSYLKFLLVLIIFSLLRTILKRYNYLRLYMELVFKRNTSNSHVLDEISNINKSFLFLTENVLNINELFRFQTFCIIGQMFMYVLICFNSVLSSYLDQISGDYKSESFMAEFHLTETFLSTVSIFYVLLAIRRGFARVY